MDPCHKPQQCRIYWLYTGKGGGKNGTAGENLSEKCSTADSGGLCAAGAGHGVPGVCGCAPGAGGYGPVPADLIRLYGVCFAGFGGHQCGVHTAGCAVPDPWARHGPDAAQPQCKIHPMQRLLRRPGRCGGAFWRGEGWNRISLPNWWSRPCGWPWPHWRW